MNEKQFSDRIGSIDDSLVRQSMHTPNYARRRRRGIWRRAVAMAAVVVFMVCSGVVGALAFGKETIVEVPIQQEIIEIREIGLTLILPDAWAGKYAFEENEAFKEYVVYNPAIREAMGGDSETPASGGMLFYLKLWDEQLTKEQIDAGGEWAYAKCRYIVTTKDGTYLLYYASDEQFTQETMEEYRQMESEICDIRFVADRALD